jgi:hypothetical protein
MFGGRRGGRRNLHLEGGAGTEGAVEAGLEWLRKNLPSSDSWDADGLEAGTTGLSLLAFLGYGETHKTPRYGHVVRGGLRYLKGIQDAAGRFGPGDLPLRAHAQAALAMAEAYGLTQSPLFKGSAQAGLDFLRANRIPGAGWAKVPGGTGPDLLTTAWAVMALKSGRSAGLEVDPKDLAEPRAWVETRAETPDQALRAAAVFLRILAGADAKAFAADEGVTAALAAPPAASDDLAWYFGTLAAFQVGGPLWSNWNRALKEGFRSAQVQDKGSELHGSWGLPGADEADRVLTTSLRTQSLEVYYRYARVLGARAGAAPESPVGPEAVRRSREAKGLSEAGSAGTADGAPGAGAAPAGTREVAGRTFEARDGTWWDTAVGPAEPRRTVARYSEEWFALARSRPEAARWLALGRVVLKVDGVAWEVTD